VETALSRVLSHLLGLTDPRKLTTPAKAYR
jgi:hypothetical protein